MKNFGVFILAIALCISILGCNGIETTKDVEDYSIEDNIEYLSSKDLKGRLTGTEGNKKAQEYIVQVFEFIQLEKHKNNSYLQEYSHKFYDPSKQQISMEIQLNEGTKKLEYGKDFLPRIKLKNTNINSKISFDINNISEKNTILVTKDMKDLDKTIENLECVLLKRDIFKKGLTIADRGIPIIQISGEVYKLLEANKNAKIEYKTTFESEEIKANNVIGKLDNNSDSAIVISAHFDHVGYAGKEIYQGAIDNASGVSTLINVAKLLKKYSLEEKFNNDILICAFNGEESGLQGSRAFVEEISKDYKNIYNINIDCVGIKDGGNLIVTNEEITKVDDELMNFVEKFFYSNGYEDIKNTYSSSDQSSFIEKNIPAISITQENLTKIHTVNDTANEIDYKYIKKISKEIFNLICELDKNNDILSDNSNIKDDKYFNRTDEEVVKRINEEEKKLNFGEYMGIDIVGKFHIIGKMRKRFSDVNEVKEYYSDIEIPQNILEYKIENITIVDTSRPDVNKLRERIGQVQKRTMKKSNIGKIDLTYMSDIKKEKSTVLNISVYNEKIRSIPKEDSDDIKYKVLKIKNREYKITYSALGENGIYDIITVVDINGEKYNISINKVEKTDIGRLLHKLNMNDIEKVKEMLNSIDIDELVKMVV